MKSSTKFKTTTSLLLVLFAFGCFALCPLGQAVLPPPDGGYPGGNTAEGQSALLNLTTGGFNTAIGFLSLRSNTDSSFNTAIGAGALLANTAFNNTATGAGALLSNTTGEENTANGAFALFSNTDGLFNTAVGAFALEENTTGSQNTAIGNSALVTNIDGMFNTATGDLALFENTTGDENTANGESTLGNNTEGNFNTAIGSRALAANTTGDEDTAVGRNSLSSNTSGNSNIALGSSAGSQVTTASNVICIGTNVNGANVNNSCFIGNIRDAVVAPDAATVLIDSAGKLGTTSGSSRRFKKEIKSMDSASESILALKPVTFRYKLDNTNMPQFGLIAEEVAKVNPNLVLRDKNGEIYTVRYDAVNAMLLNEFLKEHKTVEEQAREIREQKAAINRLGTTVETALARIEENELKTRRVNDQNEMNQFATRRIRSAGPLPHIVRND
jgi:Chaperone of endosialidase